MVDYIGVNPDGMVFDDTYSSGQPATFHMSELMPGWQEALLKMEEGAHWEVTVPAELMAGGSDRKQGIPGSEPGMYLIEFLEIIEVNTTD